MYLVNVHTRSLEEFHGVIPQYAILSHTWGSDEEEISFRDITEGSTIKPGFGTIKFDGCLRQAKTDGLNYAWIDTCCIDKTNSNELSEAITSMFSWYEKAKTCYVFLKDVPSKDESTWKSQFRKSLWFTRGWTLQELLAPSELTFYSLDWQSLGTKLQLSSIVGSVTGIPAQFLLGASKLRDASIAQRMSWASNRKTKRIEDQSYCLFGIFDVTTPLIYGEGHKAFMRLQRKIINATMDDSILAWDFSPQVPTVETQDRPRNFYAGALATSPAAFADCGKISWEHTALTREHPTATIELDPRNYLKLRLPLHSHPSGITYGLLKCRFEDDDSEKIVGIPLSRVAPGEWHDEYIRPKNSSSTSLTNVTPGTSVSSVKTLASISRDDAQAKDRQYGFSIENTVPEGLRMIDVWPAEYWDEQDSVIHTGLNFHHATTQRTWARFRHSEPASNDFLLALEIESTTVRCLALCHVMVASRDTTLDRIVHAPLVPEYTFGKLSAHNGFLSIQVETREEQRGGHPTYVVRLSPLSHMPEVTVNATSEIELLDQDINFQSIFQESQEITPKLNDVIISTDIEMAQLHSSRAQLDDVQRQLNQLEKTKTVLVERVERSAKVIASYSLEKQNLELREKKLLENLSIAQRLQSSIGKERSLKWQNSLVELLSTNIFLTSNTTIESMSAGTTRAFLQAVVNGNIAAMQFLVGSIPHIDFADAFGYTCLYSAIQRGNLSVVLWLLDQGASIYEPVGKKTTPLGWACECNHLPVVRLLFQRGAVINNLDSRGFGPLHNAVYNGNLTLAQWLLDNGANIECRTEVGETPLYLAVRQNSVPLVKFLLSKGVEIGAIDDQGRSVVYKAACLPDTIILRNLLDHGANINITDKYQASPFHVAARYGVAETVDLLISRGADLKAQTNEGLSPLRLAAENQTGSGPLRIMLDRSSSTEDFSVVGPELLSFAAASGSAESIELLIDRGVPIESTPYMKLTSLAHAAQLGNTKAAGALIKRGANVEFSKAPNGMTVLHMAADAGHMSLITALVDAGARVNRKDDKYGRTALHFAVLKDRQDTTIELLKKGADIEARSKAGHTAIYYAIRKGLEASFKLLLEKGASLRIEGPNGKMPLQYARDIAQKHKDVGSLPEMGGIIKHLENEALNSGRRYIAVEQSYFAIE